MRKLTSIALLCSVAMSLSACGVNQQSSGTKVASVESFSWRISAEKLLQADGFLSFAGLKTSVKSPLEKHASAKSRVNPARTKGHFPYTDYLRREDMLAKSNFRQLSLAQGAAGFELAALDMTSGVSGIPAPSDKPEAQMVQVAMVETTPDAPVMHAKPKADQPIRNAAMQMASLIDEKIKAGLFTQKHVKAAQEMDVSSSVVNMRMGDYEDKTRLVLDLSAAAKFDYDLNNVSSVLTVHIDGAEWDLETQRYFDDHPLISSYEVSESRGREVTLEISLKQPSKMIMSGFVRPDNSRGHRIFFDVAAL